MKFSWIRYKLKFKFDAGTSRGILKEKETWFIKLYDHRYPECAGIGEAGPLKGLSIDDRPDFLEKLNLVAREIEKHNLETLSEADLAELFDLQEFPSVVFALETALLDLKRGGANVLFDSGFSRGEQGIPINGLVWMGDKDFMQDQIEKKIQEGYSCIKMKIGAIDFETECRLLSSIRERFSEDQITLRVDANGAFNASDIFRKLGRLAEFGIHSIEQPVKPGQWELMEKVCRESPVPVALDEELIGVSHSEERKQLLQKISPQYIIIKPTLLGGFKASANWISLADDLGIGWWITSALESNIGLNAIAQFTATLDYKNYPQGLGTGQLYTNNISSPLVIKSGRLFYDTQLSWQKELFRKVL